jgi:hypothetical protein
MTIRELLEETAGVAASYLERIPERPMGSFSDPDGNGWLLQEIKTRLPGR